jgi:integrase
MDERRDIVAETRGKGEGSVYQRADGRWVGSLENGRDRKGRRRRRRVVRATRVEVVDALDRLRREAAGGVVPDTKRTLADYLDWWLVNVKAPRLKPYSLRQYRAEMESYVIPQLGHFKLGRITPGHIQGWMTTMQGFGLKPRSVNNARKVLGNALRHAAALGLIAQNPVAPIAGLPAGRAGKLDDTLTAAQADKVLAAVRGDRLEALAVLALRLGMRKGELLALRWSDVDLDGAVVHVRGTLQVRPYEHGCRDDAACAQQFHTAKCRPRCKGHANRCPQRRGGGLVIETPKTEGSERTVPLVAGTVEALRQHRARQATERLAADIWQDSDHVFCQAHGAPLSPGWVLGWWHTLTESAGVGRRRFHMTRHTCATLLLDRGVPLEVVSAILGHSQLATTADIYAKVTDDAKRRALAKLDQAASQ